MKTDLSSEIWAVVDRTSDGRQRIAEVEFKPSSDARERMQLRRGGKHRQHM
jgi:hypothetical protein